MSNQSQSADIVSTVRCGFAPYAGRYLNAHGLNEKIKNNLRARMPVNEALDAANLSYDGEPAAGSSAISAAGRCGHSSPPTPAATTTPATSPSSALSE